MVGNGLNLVPTLQIATIRYSSADTILDQIWRIKVGTNYEWIPNPEICECCKRPFPTRHIGKSSAGWCFALHVYPDEGIHNLSDWMKVWETGCIKDEYGQLTPSSEMLRVITERSFPKGITHDEYMIPGLGMTWQQFLDRNYAIEGPNGLLRHRLDEFRCIGHGIGTWDLLINDFS
jgi:hypothetical protein